MRTVMQTARESNPLTDSQITELAGELREDLRRLVPTAAPPGRDSVALERRRQERLSAILAALRRVDAGTYGICLGCRDPIPYARLAAIPETPTCIDCVWRGDSSGNN